MNAWEIRRDGGINALVAVERAKPSPGARELVVRVRAVSLNYRDLLHVLGYADRDKWPLVPCSDGAGEVVAVGRDVTRFKGGDRVAGTFFQGWDSGPISAEAMETVPRGVSGSKLAPSVHHFRGCCAPRATLVRGSAGLAGSRIPSARSSASDSSGALESGGPLGLSAPVA